MIFPFQRRSRGSLLSSWRKGMTRTPAVAEFCAFARSGAVDPGALAVAAAATAQQSRDDTLAIMEADLSVMKRATGDWGHWDDADRSMRGQNPDDQRNNLESAALFDGGAVMVMLDNSGAPRLTFADPALRPSSCRQVSCCTADSGVGCGLAGGVLQGPKQQLTAAAAARFGQQAGDMAFHRAWTEHEFGGDAAVAAAAAHQLQHPIFGGGDRGQEPGGVGSCNRESARGEGHVSASDLLAAFPAADQRHWRQQGPRREWALS